MESGVKLVKSLWSLQRTRSGSNCSVDAVVLVAPGAAEVEGVFTLFAILFFLISVVIAGIGLIGEYVGRIYQVVQQRPRFIVEKILEKRG